MATEALLNNKIFWALASALISAILTFLIQKWLNKRALFVYHVFHNQIGLTADDQIYGSVKVTWNDQPIPRLYLSKVELINESSKDFESIAVRIFTNDSLLLTQQAMLLDTTRNIEFTEEYKQKILVPKGSEPTANQLELVRHERDYIIPIMNRGQKATFELLNVAKTEKQPTIWLEIQQKGIKCEFKMAQPIFMGVPQQTAAFVGLVLTLVILIFVLCCINNLLLVGILSYAIGGTALIPGAFTVRLCKKIRKWFTD